MLNCQQTQYIVKLGSKRLKAKIFAHVNQLQEHRKPEMKERGEKFYLQNDRRRERVGSLAEGSPAAVDNQMEGSPVAVDTLVVGSPAAGGTRHIVAVGNRHVVAVGNRHVVEVGNRRVVLRHSHVEDFRKGLCQLLHQHHLDHAYPYHHPCLFVDQLKSRAEKIDRRVMI